MMPAVISKMPRFNKRSTQKPSEPMNLKSKAEVEKSIEDALNIRTGTFGDFYRISTRDVPDHHETKQRRKLCYDKIDNSLWLLTNVSGKKQTVTYQFGVLALYGKHENLLTYRESFLYKDRFYTITQLPAKGKVQSLRGFMRLVRKAAPIENETINCESSGEFTSSLAQVRVKSQKSRPKSGEFQLREEILAYIMKQILQGLAFLHGNNVMHRDIRARQIQVDATGGVVIADVLYSKILTEQEPYANDVIGEPHFMAPEMMRGWKYTQTVDVWSYGILTIEIAEDRIPWGKITDSKEVMLKVVKSVPPQLSANHGYSPQLPSMLQSCLQHNIHTRATAEKLLEHKFFKKACEKEDFVSFAQSYM